MLSAGKHGATSNSRSRGLDAGASEPFGLCESRSFFDKGPRHMRNSLIELVGSASHVTSAELQLCTRLLDTSLILNAELETRLIERTRPERKPSLHDRRGVKAALTTVGHTALTSGA
jgi:hypothetical protein